MSVTNNTKSIINLSVFLINFNNLRITKIFLKYTTISPNLKPTKSFKMLNPILYSHETPDLLHNFLYYRTKSLEEKKLKQNYVTLLVLIVL